MVSLIDVAVSRLRKKRGGALDRGCGVGDPPKLKLLIVRDRQKQQHNNKCQVQPEPWNAGQAPPPPMTRPDGSGEIKKKTSAQHPCESK